MTRRYLVVLGLVRPSENTNRYQQTFKVVFVMSVMILFLSACTAYQLQHMRDMVKFTESLYVLCVLGMHCGSYTILLFRPGQLPELTNDLQSLVNLGKNGVKIREILHFYLI